MEAATGFEPVIRVLQTRALPLGYAAVPRRFPLYSGESGRIIPYRARPVTPFLTATRHHPMHDHGSRWAHGACYNACLKRNSSGADAMYLLDWLLIALGIVLGGGVGAIAYRWRIRRQPGRLQRLIEASSSRDHEPPGGDLTGRPVRPTRTPPSLRGAAEAISETNTAEIAVNGRALTA